MLALIDAALLASLVVMVIISGYENFVSRFDHADGSEISWLGKVDAGSLKIKVASTIVAISSIHFAAGLPQRPAIYDGQLMWLTIIHLAFVVSALIRLHRQADEHGQEVKGRVSSQAPSPPAKLCSHFASFQRMPAFRWHDG